MIFLFLDNQLSVILLEISFCDGSMHVYTYAINRTLLK